MKAFTEELPRLRELLGTCTPPLPKEEAVRLAHGAGQLAEAFTRLDDVVAVGIAGGTGVGKSTLINALAGAEITAVSPTRPTTDCIVLYRHRQTPFATRLPPDVAAVEESVHSSEDLRRVVILDLPDCDSAYREHRRILMQVLPHIDLLLLLVDPEKYADRAFYDILDGLRQAPQNCLVVFNKIDSFTEQYGEKADHVLCDLLSDAKEKLAEHFSAEVPSLYPISAARAYEAKRQKAEIPASFAALEAFLQRLADRKQRERVKRCNLNAAFQSLKHRICTSFSECRVVEKATAFDRALSEAASELASGCSALVAETFTPQRCRQFGAFVASRAAQGWSFPARFTAGALGLLHHGPFEGSLLVQEKLKAFRQRRERVLQKLLRLYRRSYGEPFPGKPPAAVPPWHFETELQRIGAARGSARFWPPVACALCVLLFFCLRPSLLEAVRGIQHGDPVASVLRDTVLAALESFLVFSNPLLVVLWVGIAAVVYAAGVAVGVLRLREDAASRLQAVADSLKAHLEEISQASLKPFYRHNSQLKERTERVLSLCR